MIIILIVSSIIAFVNFIYRRLFLKNDYELKAQISMEPIDLSADESKVLGYYHFSEKSYDKALSYFDHSISLQPSHITYTFRGNTFFNLKQFNSAIYDYDQAIKISNIRADLYFNRGKAYYEKEEYELAKRNWVIASKLGNETAGIFLETFEDKSIKNTFYCSDKQAKDREAYKWN